MHVRVAVFALVLWLPLHLFHFRAAQALYLALCAGLFAVMATAHASQTLASILGAEVLGNSADGAASHRSYQSHPHGTWLASSTRGSCGAPCMMLVDAALAFGIVRLLLAWRAVRLGGTDVLSVLPYTVAVAAPSAVSALASEENRDGGGSVLSAIISTTGVAATATADAEMMMTASSSTPQANAGPPVATRQWSFLKLLARRNTLVDAALQRSVVLPLAICSLDRVVPSLGAGLLIAEVPYMVLAIAVLWMKSRKSRLLNNGGAAPALVVPQRTIGDRRGPVGLLLLEHELCNHVPVVAVLLAFAVCVGFTLTIAAQLIVERKDWGPRAAPRLALIGTTVAHALAQIACAVRLLGEPLRCMVLWPEGSPSLSSAGRASATSPSSKSHLT